MKKHTIYLPFAVLVTALSACSTPPQQDIPALTAGIDASVAGHYGQAILHEDQANKTRAVANKVLEHWTNDHYWNIDEYQKGMIAATDSAAHRLESEKHLCQWLTEVHGQNHPQDTAFYQAVAYFRTGVDTPFKVNNEDIAVAGHWLQLYPNATADVTASADTIGSASSNQSLSDRRSDSISKLLMAHGARAEQLHVTALGEQGPPHTASQANRSGAVGAIHFNYADCPNVK
jgi:outer membrane protein OmpA-like peptidoglycan-associated protein